MSNKSSDCERYDTYEIREQDRWLPIANVDRVMRNCLPKNTKISKETRECMQECVSEFILFVTSQAAEKCLIEKRKTLNGEDILYALYSLGFENYAEVLRIYLAKYRIFELDEVEKRRKKYLARKERLQKEKKENKYSSMDGGDDDDDDDDDVYEEAGKINHAKFNRPSLSNILNDDPQIFPLEPTDEMFWSINNSSSDYGDDQDIMMNSS